MIKNIKKAINYQKIVPRCDNCKYYKEIREKNKYGYYIIKKRICKLYEFTTKAHAICDKYEHF